MTSVKEWIEKEIRNNHIRYFEYNEFSQINEIDRGAFGKVSKANLADTGLVALKILFNKSSKEINEDNYEFIKELKLLREVDYHQNINRILGITKDSEHYILVLEYANEGSLRDYLKKRFDSLEWNDKIQMALDITSGLRFLHSKEIIHRDLHSKNILVNNRKLVIADLGLSKKLKEVMANNSLGNEKGVIAYTEPQCLKNIKYKKDEKSDIYSLGVLLWEISSGRPPFINYPQDTALAFHISHNNLREDPIDDTPPKYQELYQKCWESEPKKRPNIKEVYEILSRLNPEDPFDTQSPPPNTHKIYDSNPDTGSFHISSNYLIPRNLLVVGRTLTLSNVLCGTDDIRENEYTINNIKNLQKKDFEWNGSKYYVIEIVFESIEKKVYDEIRDLMPEGISQVLFVVDKSFTTEEKAMFKLFKKVIFESGILKYVTIVRNEFDKDQNYVFEENDIIAEMVKSCNNTIYINNPPIFTCDEDENIVNRDARKRSRDILLNHLRKECQEEFYKLEKWDDLFSKIEVEETNITNSRKEEPIEGPSQECQDDEPKPSSDIEDKLKSEEYITYYEYSEFKITRNIGKGSFGNVHSALWKNTGQVFVLKYFNGDKTTLKEIIYEIKLHKRLGFHENFLQFYGITTVKKADTIQKYALVLEFADSGTLRTYLSHHFNDLKWDDKYRFAFQLASAVACIHECDIIHRDLHAENVYVHQKKIKLADFGLSKKIAASSNNPNVFGLIPYIDPKKLNDQKYYELNKKSDVYSVGVLMWQISSGYQPYRNDNYDVSLATTIINGRREEIIDGTPAEYSKLYKECWKYEPHERPNMQDIVSTLKALTSPEQNSTAETESNLYLQSKMSDGKPKSKVQAKFNTQYSNEKEINIVGNKSIFSFFKPEFTKLEGSLKIEGFNNLEIISLKSLKLNSLKVNDCSQLNKIDLSELAKLTSLSVRDCPKLTTDGCSLIGLTRLKSLIITNCSRFKKLFDLSVFPKLESLSVRNCPKLTKLDCSSTMTLTELEVSDLEELNCSNTSIGELSLILCPNITKLICSNNKKLNKLDLSNCFNLDFLDCIGSKLTSIDLSYCPKFIKVEPSDLIITRKIDNFRNILIVGRTGGGKSTLANTLTDTSNFKESAYSISQTKNFNKIDFKWNEKNFRVVDTIGVGDTKLSTENTLYKIAEGILSMPEGISHVLFVIDGRFTGDEIDTFNMIKDSIFKSGVLDYVTIVRTKFPSFGNRRECEMDLKKMREENELIAEIVDSCNGVVHVNNPPINIIKVEDDKVIKDDQVVEIDVDYEDRILVNKNARKRSRKKTLDYLEEKYKDERFISENWEVLCNKIVEYTRNNNLQKLEIDSDILKLSKEACLIL